MSATAVSTAAGLDRFRRKLMGAMVLVMAAVAVPLMLVAQRNQAARAQLEFEREFQGGLAARHEVELLRHAKLDARAKQLARRSRIHAALEDGANDLLYPSARSELADLGAADSPMLRPRFYRFLDAHGQVIPAGPSAEAGTLDPASEARLSLPQLPSQGQTAYLLRADQAAEELILAPITSTETGETIAALVLGFPLGTETGGDQALTGGVFEAGQLYLPGLPLVAREDLETELRRRAAGEGGRFEFRSLGVPYVVFFQRLDGGTAYPRAYEVSVGSLVASVRRQHVLAWQFAGVGLLVLAVGVFATHFASRRLADPVERLAVDSEENRALRHRAEAALETTHQELQRSVRFSADASHQLKTPVSVLRAGLEGLLAGQRLNAAVREEISGLLHQTYRLGSLIEDLLLLSRLDAGRLQLQSHAVDLAPLLEALVDDLSAVAGPLELEIETDLAPSLWVQGEKNYLALVLENLFENARKYNQPHGRIGVASYEDVEWAVIGVGNTGPEIPPAIQEHIFERFHRGAVGEDVPGHGIGLNLARELARLHGGDLRLTKARAGWTEFELRLRRSPPVEKVSP